MGDDDGAAAQMVGGETQGETSAVGAVVAGEDGTVERHRHRRNHEQRAVG